MSETDVQAAAERYAAWHKWNQTATDVGGNPYLTVTGSSWRDDVTALADAFLALASADGDDEESDIVTAMGVLCKARSQGQEPPYSPYEQFAIYDAPGFEYGCKIWVRKRAEWAYGTGKTISDAINAAAAKVDAALGMTPPTGPGATT